MADDGFGYSLAKAEQLYEEGLRLLKQKKAKDAFVLLRQAAKGYAALGQSEPEAEALHKCGVAQEYLHQYNQAVDYYEQALDLYPAESNLALAAKSYYRLGKARTGLRQYPQAKDCFEAALALYERAADAEGGAKMRAELAGVEKFLPRAKPSSSSRSQPSNSGLGSGQSTSTNSRALQAADQTFQQGLQLYNQCRYQEALIKFQQVLPIYQDLKDRIGEGESLSNLGIAYQALGQYAKAIDFHSQSLSIKREIGVREAFPAESRNGEALSLSNLGLALYRDGYVPEAEAPLEQALDVLESLRQTLTDDHKVSFFETMVSPYTTLQQVHIAQNKSEPALEVAERGRTRAFVELPLQRSSAMDPQAMATQFDIRPPSIDQIKSLAQQLGSTLVEYSVISSTLIYVWVVQPKGKIHFEEINVEKTLNTNLGGLHNAFQKMRQATSTRDAYDPTPLDAALDELSRLISRTREGEVAFTNYLQDAYRLLIQPIAEYLPESNDSENPPALIFIPHRQLFTVPFAALENPDTRKALIEDYTIQVAPSIQVLELTHQQHLKLADHPWTTPALVVGDPTMPEVTLEIGSPPQKLDQLDGAKEEADKVAALLNTQPLTREAARKSTVVQHLTQSPRLVHLATHGILNEIQGLGVPGAIALAPDGSGEPNDGLLTADEILDLTFEAELVVLSCCNTGLGNITGDGVIGLSRVLITAGVPSVVVSLWPVPDRATATLMTAFYQYRQTCDNAQALRKAMVDTKKTHSNTKSWAGFVLIGSA